MSYTLSPNLKLRLDSNLTSNARFNLLLLDNLASATTVDTSGNVLLRSRTGIQLTANDPSVGGSGAGGSLTLGTPSQPLTAATIYATSTTLSGALTIGDQAPSAGTLALAYNSTAGSNSTDTAARKLTFNVAGADRQVTFGGDFQTSDAITLTGPANVTLPATGTLVSLDGVQRLTNKVMSGSANSFSNIPYTALGLINQVKNSDISATAGIAYSKLNLAGSITNGDIANAAGIPYSKLTLTASLVDADIAANAAIAGSKVVPSFGNQLVQSGTGLALGAGGYTTTVQAASGSNWTLTLPNGGGTAGQVLSTDGSGGTTWSTIAGSGTVTSVALTAPAEFSVAGSPITTAGTFALTKANQSANTVWAGPTSGVPAAPTFRALVGSDLPGGTGNISSPTTGVSVSGGTSAVLGSGVAISIATASTSNTGLLTNADWNTFNGKQAAGSYLTALTGDVVAAGPGSAAATIQAGAVTTAALAAGAVTTAKLAAGAVDLTSKVTGLLPAGYGGTGLDTSASTGVAKVAAGTWSVASLVNADVSGSAAIAYSKLNLSASIATGDLASGLLVPVNKGGTGLTAGTSGGILGFTATGTLASSGLLAANQVVIGGGAGATPSTLAAGTNGQVLGMVSGSPAWTGTIVTSNKATWLAADGTTKTITHNLGSTDVMVQVWDAVGAGAKKIGVDSVTATDTNTVTLTASSAPSVSWRVLILAV